MIDVKNLTKRFRLSGQKHVDEVTSKSTTFKDITVLKNLTFQIPDNLWVSLTGPSGSGKSTLLGILAGLDYPSEGQITVDNYRLHELDEEAKAHFRSRNVGFIFQNFRLLPTLTALENVAVPLEILKIADADAQAEKWLARVGLEHRKNHLPTQLSGGEQQRIAIARSFVHQPKLLFADEPTGNLDSKNGQHILDLLRELQTENKTTLIVVTHDPGVAAYGQMSLRLKDGEIASDSAR